LFFEAIKFIVLLPIYEQCIRHANSCVSQVVESTWAGETLAALRCPYAGNAASRCRGPVVTAGLEVSIHFGRVIRQGRKVDLSPQENGR
jgi:hypothetical protein